MCGLIGYSLVAFVVVLYLPYQTARVVIVTLLASLVLLVGFSRIYLGAHYLSDVLGGFALAGAWMAVWLAIMPTLRKRREELPESPPLMAEEQVGV
jgi:undecaprenyl-diphosphatase